MATFRALSIRPIHLVLACASLFVFGLAFEACSNGGDQASDTNSSTIRSSESSGEAGDKTAFCGFVSDINASTDGADTVEEQLAVLRAFEPRFDQAQEDAPTAMKPHISVMLDASRAALKDHAFDPALADSVGEAGYQVDHYCDGVASGK